MAMDIARLILENGMVFPGRAFGHIQEALGEVVFTTGMTGYQETLTDPSFAGQIVVMTYPLIGNYGLNLEDMEADRPALRALIVKEACDLPNNWRCEMELTGFLKQHKVVGLCGVDTRALTRVLRSRGIMKGFITTEKHIDEDWLKEKFNAFTNADAVREVCCKKRYEIGGSGQHIAYLDFGAKAGILRELKEKEYRLTVLPPFTSSREILELDPDAVFLSSGPGNPEDLPEVIATIKELIGKKPIAGICLGHQLLALALGCKTARLPFGHHGGNHPVKDLETGRCYITSQNHEFVVSEIGEDVEVTYRNVNDGTIEGIRHKSLPVQSVQFHPEASPGPLDTRFLFEKLYGRGVE